MWSLHMASSANCFSRLAHWSWGSGLVCCLLPGSRHSHLWQKMQKLFPQVFRYHLWDFSREAHIQDALEPRISPNSLPFHHTIAQIPMVTPSVSTPMGRAGLTA